MPFLTRKAFAGEDDYLRIEQFAQISQRHAQCLVDFHLARGKPVVIDGQCVVQDTVRLSGKENYIVIGHIEDDAYNSRTHTPPWACVAYAVEIHCPQCSAAWDKNLLRKEFRTIKKLWLNGEDFGPKEHFTLPIMSGELTGEKVCTSLINDHNF